MPQVSPFGRGFALTIAASSLLGAFGVSLVAKAVEGGTTKPPEYVSPCRRECYAAFGECNKAAGDNAEKREQCKANGNACMNKCPAETAKPQEPKKEEPKKEPTACQRGCFAALGICGKAAGDNEGKREQCKKDGNLCMEVCQASGDKPAENKDKEKAYQEAAQAARQRFLEGQRKLSEEYQAALEKAWMARMK